MEKIKRRGDRVYIPYLLALKIEILSLKAHLRNLISPLFTSRIWLPPEEAEENESSTRVLCLLHKIQLLPIPWQA